MLHSHDCSKTRAINPCVVPTQDPICTQTPPAWGRRGQCISHGWNKVVVMGMQKPVVPPLSPHHVGRGHWGPGMHARA